MYVLLLISVAVLWKLQGWFFKKYWAKDLSVHLAFRDSHIYEGDTSVLKEVVVNDKRLPLAAVHIRLVIPRLLEFADEVRENTVTSDQTYKRDVFSFMGRQQITRSLPFTAKRRGFYELKKVDMTGNDYFFHQAQYISQPQEAQLYVFPRQIATSRIHLLCREISGTMITNNRLHPDPFEFSGIRDYQKSDPMNHINWKASARNGSLMVNQYDSTTSMNITVLLDAEDNGIMSREQLTEEGIRIASSLAGRMAGQKMPFKVTSNSGIDLFLPAGGSHMLELNRQLAMIDTAKPECSVSELVDRQLAAHVNGHTFVLISPHDGEEMRAAAARLAAADNQVLWVLPFDRNTEVPRFSMPSVRLLPWEVMA